MALGTIGAPSLVRQLAGWRSTASAADPGWRQLARAIRLLLRDGRLPLDNRMPGERDLAAALGVSRTMVTAAYTQLREEGFIMSRQGSGSLTCLPDRHASGPAAPPPPLGEGTIDMSCAALPATSSVYTAFEDAVADLPQWLRGDGYDYPGIAPLRAAIAAGYAARGCPTDPDQILVTSGAQSALALLLHVLTAPGDRIAVDHPTYHNGLIAIARASCRAVPVMLSRDGWDMDGMAAVLRQANPRLAYIVADNSNPTGQSMDIAARRALVDMATRSRTALVVDETMLECWIDAAPPPPVAAFDRDGVVISIGSLGKRFWGGLRIGWIRAEPSMIARLSAYRPSFDLGSPVMEQLVATRLLTQDQRVEDAERRALLRARRDHLAGLVERHLPEWRFDLPAGGLSLWVELPTPVSTALAAMAEGMGLRIAPGPRFGVDGAFERFVRLPFTLPEERQREGVEILARCWAQLRPGSGRRPASAPYEGGSMRIV